MCQTVTITMTITTTTTTTTATTITMTITIVVWCLGVRCLLLWLSVLVVGWCVSAVFFDCLLTVAFCHHL